MDDFKDEISFALGYSPEYGLDSEFKDLLGYLFEEYVHLRFHAEETSDVTVRVSVEGRGPRGTLPISERFGGKSGKLHQTKNGAFLRITFCDGLVTIARPIAEGHAVPRVMQVAAE